MVAVAALLLLLLPGQARAATLQPCGKTKGLVCTTVNVPLDPTGVVPGTVPLYVQELPATGFSTGVAFLIAGGPGQGSAQAFDLGDPTEAQFLQFILPGYTLVAFDGRGTGKSDVLNCPALQNAVTVTADQEAALAGACAATLGPDRQFYATSNHVQDIESVRKALGAGKIALFGVSYGTKLALAYSLAFPQNVQRLLLDSVLPPSGPAPFFQDVLPSMPHTLSEYCPGTSCRAATPNYSADVIALANQLEAKPIQGTILAPGGRRETVHMNGEDLLSTVLESDLDPGLGTELPAAVHAARNGYIRPLLRLFDLTNRTDVTPAEDLSVGLYAATTCADGQFPWDPNAPIADRPAEISSAVAALPAGSFGPFGDWAANLGTAVFCKEWPSPAGGAPLASGPYPNVPMLAVSGGLDFRTPTAGAASIVRQFPQGHLLVVPGVGHSVLTADLSFCSARAVRAWVSVGVVPPSTCPRVAPWEKPLGALPTKAPRRAPAATLVAATKTLREAEATWLQLLATSSNLRPAGIVGGSLRASATAASFTMTSYAIAPGLKVSGKLTLVGAAIPFRLKGTVHVTGAAATAGTLRINGLKVTGTLGGRHVSGGF